MLLVVDDRSTTAQSMHGLLRPETSESLFYLWRITGDRQYRRWGEHILDALLLEARTADGAFAPLKTVSPGDAGASGGAEEGGEAGRYVGTLPSFVIAETLKYLLLLFEDSDIVDLSTHVFNTEGHLLPKFSTALPRFNASGGGARASGGAKGVRAVSSAEDGPTAQSDARGQGERRMGRAERALLRCVYE
jgi:hypothetical protein